MVIMPLEMIQHGMICVRGLYLIGNFARNVFGSLWSVGECLGFPGVPWKIPPGDTTALVEVRYPPSIEGYWWTNNYTWKHVGAKREAKTVQSEVMVLQELIVSRLNPSPLLQYATNPGTNLGCGDRN